MKQFGIYTLLVVGVSFALLTSYLATSNCCERLNVLAMVGLTKPG